MKIIAFFLLIVVFALVGCTQNTCLVRGKIKGLEDGVILEIYQDNGQLLELLGSDIVKRGEFSFKVPQQKEEPELLQIYGKTEQGFPNQSLGVWCSAGQEVEITGDNKLLGSWRVKSGLQEQQDQNRYVDATYEWIQAKERLLIKSEELRAYANANLQTITDQEKEKLMAADNRLEAQIDSINILIDKKVMEMMKTSSVGKVWLDQMYGLAFDCRYLKGFPYRKEVGDLYTRLTEEQKQSAIGQVIKTNIFPPEIVQVGDQAADADLYDLKGQIHHLSDYRGKFVLLDFWSCGCGSCMQALPEIRKVMEDNSEKLVVVSLSIDDEKNWKETSARENMTWENLNDRQGQSGLYAKYGATGLPLYVIISPEGKVLHRWNGYGKGIIELNLLCQMDRMDCVMAVEQLPADGKAAFTLTFGPLPGNTKSFDFIEGDSQECFKLLGVALE